jgi:hypothetical protein
MTDFSSILSRLGEEVSLVLTVFNNFPLDVSALLVIQDSEHFSFVLLPDERISKAK